MQQLIGRFITADIASKEDLKATKDDLKTALELQTLRITLRIGAMLAVGCIAAMVVIRVLIGSP
jgi:hypothetical protein